MKLNLTKTAAVLAFIIGAMAIAAGGQVVLGKVMDYYVIDWLPIYNLAAGLVSALVTAFVIWKGCKLALPLTLVTLASHVTVMVILLTAYGGVVASDSLTAMSLRIGVWLVVTALMVIAARRDAGGLSPVQG